MSVDGDTPFRVNSAPSIADTDFDGLPDFVERDLGSDPNKADTDADGISDYDEINDLSKYVTLAALYPGLNIDATITDGLGTSPILPDTDEDGLNDYQEAIEGFRVFIPGQTSAQIFYTSPVYADSDLDGLTDYQEIKSEGTDPTVADTGGTGESMAKR